MRVHRPHEGDMQRPGQTDVVNVMGQSLYQSRIFGALHALPNVFVSHDYALAFFAAYSIASTMC
jgi:hypothetical protein